MNAVKQKIEVVECPILKLAPQPEVKIEKPKRTLLANLFGFFMRKKSDLTYEAWESLEYRRTIPQEKVDAPWVINHRWYI